MKPTKIVIREDLDHFSPVGVDWLKGFTKAGYDAILVSRDSELVNIEADLFINMSNIHTNIEYIRQIKAKNPTTYVLCTVLKPLEKLEPYFNYVDCWFDLGAYHPYYQEWFESRDQKFISVLEASDPEELYDLKIPNSQKTDFSFVGQFGNTGHGYRHEDLYLYPFIDDSTLSHNLFGFSYKTVPYRRVNFKDINLVYNNSIINVNFHYSFQKYENVVLNRRTFHVAMSGNFQLIDHPNYPDLFNELPSYPDPKDFREAFYYYRNNEEERSKITKQAQEWALKHHTWEVRMNELLKTI
jgi:hypothetical protein